MIGRLLHVYLLGVALTSRIRICRESSPAAIEIMRDSRPSVLTFWFQNIFSLLYFFRSRNIPLLLTPKHKSDLFTNVAGYLGLRLAVGALDAGGRHAIVSLLDRLKEGTPVALAADGQRGPPEHAKAGCFILSQESGAPLVPVSCRILFGIKIPRRRGPLVLPLPFNSIRIRFHAPIQVAKHRSFEDLGDVKKTLEAALNEAGEGHSS